MMRETSKRLLIEDIPVIVSLNPVMLDGSSMCGGCKISRKNGKISSEDFACNNGPDRLASDVNLNELVSRLSSFQADENSVLVYHIERKLEELLAPGRGQISSVN